MRGDLEQLLNAKAKIIRVFTSSTFTGKRLVIRNFSYSNLWILDSHSWVLEFPSVGSGSRSSLIPNVSVILDP